MATKYSLSNFVSYTTGEDDIRIYDSNKKLKYIIKLINLTVFYNKNSKIFIKMDDTNDIILEFSNSTEANQALAKLNNIKNSIGFQNNTYQIDDNDDTNDISFDFSNIIKTNQIFDNIKNNTDIVQSNIQENIQTISTNTQTVNNTYATYSLSNFISTPVEDDTLIRIFDRNKNLRYVINPSIGYFYVSQSVVQIKIEDSNDIYLDFSSPVEAENALAKLNDVKKELLAKKPSVFNSVISSISNLNMVANVTVNDGDLACNVPLILDPKVGTEVSVFVNGIQVNVGGKSYPYDCYFSVDNGVTAKAIGTEKANDYLYWNQSVAKYNLDNRDIIDFEYLIVVHY